jgi:hypothetical protein
MEICVCIIRTVHEPLLCRDGQKKIESRQAHEEAKLTKKQNWKYGESWQDNPQY